MIYLQTKKLLLNPPEKPREPDPEPTEFAAPGPRDRHIRVRDRNFAYFPHELTPRSPQRIMTDSLEEEQEAFWDSHYKAKEDAYREEKIKEYYDKMRAFPENEHIDDDLFLPFLLEELKDELCQVREFNLMNFFLFIKEPLDVFINEYAKEVYYRLENGIMYF